MKISKRYIISIVFSLLIISLVSLNIFRVNYSKSDSKYFAEKGVLDLEGSDIANEELVKLDGEWEFYSGKLIDPDESFESKVKQYVNVPGDWESYLKDEGLENGSGTYRLIIKVPEDMVYGIKAKTIRTAYRIYLNGEKIAQAGNPSLDKNAFRAQSKYKLGVASSLDKEIELIVHVSSLNYRSGGIHKSLEIGSFEPMMSKEKRNLTIDAFLVAICLTLSLYFLAMYFQRNREAYLAYFSGTSLFMGLYLSTMNEQVLRLLYDYQQNQRVEIQILAMVLTAMCFLRCIHHFYKEYSNKKLVNIITALMLTVLSLALIIISKEEIDSLGSIQIVVTTSIVIAYAYIIYILIKAIYNRTNSIEYIIIIFTAMLSYWASLLIKTFSEIDLGHTPVFIMLLLMFSVAALTSDRLQMDYEEAKRLSQKFERYDQLKDEFFEKASKQLKIRLELISTLTKNLLEGKDGMLNIPQQETLFKIQQQTEGLGIVADDLMDSSLIKAGKIKKVSESIDIYENVDDILKEMEVLIIDYNSIDIKNNIAKDFPPVKANSNRFKRIIYELIDNAIKFTNNGEISIRADLVDGQAEIKVTDTGIGIERAYLKEVFDVFYQRSDSEDLKNGLGIGLHIVRRLVELQGGEIYVTSLYGKGTSFVFTLPLYTEKDKINKNDDTKNIYKVDKESSNKKNYEVKRKSILIVETEPINKEILKKTVDELDYETILVKSGKGALKILKEEKIDLVVSDFILSDMTSIELCSRIRKEYSMGELPILILTSSAKTTELMSSFNYGVSDFQRKPVDKEELKSRIQSLLLIKSSAEEGLEKEFQYFYSQISPHFLYNTLNSIIGISYSDVEKSRQALNNLSVYLRGKLDIHRKKGFVTLESELEIVRAYLEIEELRYGDKLEVVYDIEEGLKAKIPPLTLQPIVENAVHHGIASKVSGKIKVATKKEKDGFINIIIEDNGIGMTVKQQEELMKGNGKGIGFKNVVERIRLLKGADLILESELNNGTKINIIIPGVRNNEGDENNFD